MDNENMIESIEIHKDKIIENINRGKGMGVNRISAILAMEDQEETIQKELITWLIKEGYKVSLKSGECNILIIEW